MANEESISETTQDNLIAQNAATHSENTAKTPSSTTYQRQNILQA